MIPNWDSDAEFGEHTAHHVDQLRTLLDQQAANAMKRQRRLLLARLDGHEPHRLTGDRFADRLGVSCIVLTALHIRLHVSRRHQPYLMTKPGQFARPMVRRSAGLGTYQTWRLLLEKRQHLRSSQRLAYHDLPGRADAVHLKNVLGQIQADRANLHRGWLLARVRMTATHLGTQMP